MFSLFKYYLIEAVARILRRFLYFKYFISLSIVIWKNRKAPLVSKRGINHVKFHVKVPTHLLYSKETSKFVLATVVEQQWSKNCLIII